MSGLPRREFLVGLAGFGSVVALRQLEGQQTAAANFAPMEQGAYRPTLLPSKAGATPLLTPQQRDDLEHRIKCQCGCTLDIYTCRTTDFTCQVSPAMHRDVLRMVDGGHSADEILEAFVTTYGEVALTVPKKEGFNWAGYLAPGIAMATGAVVLTFFIRRWSQQGRLNAEARGALAPAVPLVDATPDEMERLKQAMRERDEDEE